MEKEVQLHLIRSHTGFPTSHPPRLYAATNFLKMGIKYLNLSSFGQFRQQRTRSPMQSFICIETLSGKVVAQSIAFWVASIYWQGVAPFLWYLNAKGPTPIGSTCVAYTSPHSAKMRHYVSWKTTGYYRKYNLKFAARCPVSGCWPFCHGGVATHLRWGALFTISWRLYRWKNIENRLRFDTIIAMSLMSSFFGTPCTLS